MANENRLISAEDFKKAFYVDDDRDEIRFGVDGKVFVDFKAVQRAIDEAPTVDAVEVVHGRWEQVQRWATKAKYRCSVCGREIMSSVKVNIEKYPYCHCGAKMDGGNEDGNL